MRARSVLFVWLLLSMLWHGGSAAPGDAVAILVSDENRMYQEMIGSFKKNCPARVAEFQMLGNPALGLQQIGKINAGGFAAVLAVGARAAQIAKERSKVPVIFCGVFGSSRKRLVGRNITGIILDAAPKSQLTVLRKVLPKLRSVGVIYDPRVSSELIIEARAACTQLGISLETREVSSPKEVTWAVRDLASNIDVLWVVADNTVVNAENIRYMLLISMENRIPLAAFSQTFVEQGALLSVAATNETIGAEAANLARTLLGGQPAAAIPITSPRHTDVFVNLKTARNLQLSIPSAVLAGAKVYGGPS